jgi:hypothetical protein
MAATLEIDAVIDPAQMRLAGSGGLQMQACFPATRGLPIDLVVWVSLVRPGDAQRHSSGRSLGRCPAAGHGTVPYEQCGSRHSARLQRV